MGLNRTVDIMVSSGIEKKLESDFSKQGIQWILVMNNVQQAIDQQNIPAKR